MYQFKIKKQESGDYRFELGAIKLLVDGYTVNEGKHLLTNPNKTVGYFNIGNNVYGVSNDLMNFPTAEAFYEAIKKQYLIFTGNESTESHPHFDGSNRNITGSANRLGNHN